MAGKMNTIRKKDFEVTLQKKWRAAKMENMTRARVLCARKCLTESITGNSTRRLAASANSAIHRLGIKKKTQVLEACVFWLWTSV